MQLTIQGSPSQTMVAGKAPIRPPGEGGSKIESEDGRVLMLVSPHYVEKLYVLTPLGLMNSEAGSDLRFEIDSLLRKAPKDILIDCRDIEFMDSSGFGSLVSALKRVREHGKQLYLCSLNSQLRMVLELTGTDGVFPIFPSRRECLEFVSHSQLDD
jgi:anti-anti-sigma factor